MLSLHMLCTPVMFTYPFYTMISLCFCITLSSNHTQTLSGLTLEQGQTESFRTAVFRTVGVAVGVPRTDVSGTVDAATANARRLLADIDMVYNLGILTNLSSTQTISKLKSNVDSGVFLENLKLFSGLNITKMANTRFNDETPTSSPTMAPTVLILPDAQPGTNISNSFLQLSYMLHHAFWSFLLLPLHLLVALHYMKLYSFLTDSHSLFHTHIHKHFLIIQETKIREKLTRSSSASLSVWLHSLSSSQS